MEKVCGVTKALPWALSFILAFAAAEVSVAAPVTTSLPAVADTTLRQQQANQNRGGDEQVRLGWAQGSRALVRFDPAAVAAAVGDGTLLSAHLELDVEGTGESWPGGSQNVGAHRVTAAWTETGATWNCAVDTQPADNRADCNPQWNGGSFLAAATATVPHTKETRGLVRFDVTADVAAFLAGTANHGWLLKKANETLSGRIDYVSREGTAAARAPRLVVVVEPRSGVDQTPPVITIVSPSGVDILGNVLPPAEVVYSDALSGIDLQSLRVSLDGTALACAAGPTGATCPIPELADGIHSLVAQVRDLGGNSAVAERGFRTVSDLAPPTVAIVAPADGTFLTSVSPQISASFADAGSGIDPDSVRLLVDGIDLTAEAAVAATGLTWTPSEPLAETLHSVAVEVADRAGHRTGASAAFTVDATPPVLTVETPASGLSLNREQVEVAGEATDENGTSVTVNGQPVSLSGGRFEVTLNLAEGSQTVTVRAVDPAGNARDEARQVTRFTLPQVSIAEPEDLSTVAATTMRVRGTVSDPAATVKVNGVTALVSGNTFTSEDVPLVEGGNVVTATATSVLGRMGTATINVVRDLTAPQVLIHDPEDGALLFTPTVTVSGMINDIVAGTVNASEATVTVNGRPAAVANRSFVVEGVPLQPGENVLTAMATDEGGNTSQGQITVRLEAPTVPRLAVVSGDLQIGEISSPLAQPLVVAVLDAAGQPVAGLPVLFSVRDGNGRLDGGLRQVARPTGADGRAQAHFTLGTRAGVANQVVEASAVGFAGPAVFRVTARTGEVQHILPDAGVLQVGVAGQPLPRPLVAAITDAGFNRLEGVEVRLRVIQGGGRFAEGLPETVAVSDSDGRILVPFTLGPEEGIANNVVEATVLGLDPSPRATFVASGWVAGDPAATSISGVVLDNVNQPVPGVILRIKEQPGLTAQADAQGQFRIAGAPVGTIHLIVDGSTAARPGSWPDLEFVLTTVSGRDNTVNMPIYLLPINLADGLVVDETRGGVLTLPEFPGFALHVPPGSVTFPGGSRSGVISVTAVHADKVPMVPNFGQQPRFIVTIQPAGARFDPPARLSLPNLEGLAPGEVTEMYSFDHDLGHFVSIGPGTVSDDGLVILANAGVGVIKAGWHCGGNPAAAGTPADCPSCKICDGNACVPGCALGSSATGPGVVGIFEAQCNCTDDGDDCTVNDRCRENGGCRGDDVNVTEITGHCATNVGTPVTLTATVSPASGASRVRWTAAGGSPPTGNGGSFSPSWSSEGFKTVTARCKTGRSKGVSVLKKCSDGVTEPTVINAVPSIPPNHDGYFYGHNPTYFLIPCTNAPSNQYCLALTKFESRAGYALATGHVADINSAADVVPADCVQVLADLRPNPASTWGQPPTAQYWSSQITRAHEEKHLQDWINMVLKPTLTELNAYLATKCQDCSSPLPSADVAAKYLEILNAKTAAFELVKEPGAFAQSNAAYSSLVAAIRARAQAENWNVACQ